MKDFMYRCCGCGKSFPGTRLHFRCEDCGEPMEVDYVRHGKIAKDSFLGNTILERFADFFPFSETCKNISMREGFTPLVESEKLENEFGVKKVYLKNESQNPTWSFKDRGTVAGLNHALSLGYKAIGTVSTGNMAASVAAYGSRAGLKTFILVDHKLPPEKLNPIVVYGADVIKVEGDYGNLYFESLKIGKDLGIYFINSDSPFRVEGSKTIAFEIYEQMKGDNPDFVIVPTSAGGNIRGIAKGFKELKQCGLIDNIPIIICAQAEGCSPIASAWEKGESMINRVNHPETIAHAIENPFPPSGNEVLRMLVSVKGMCVSVSDNEILDAQKKLAHEGIFIQPASATPIAVMAKLKERGYWKGNEKVACVLTGSGLKFTAVFEKLGLSSQNCKIRELGNVIAELMDK